LRYVSRAAARCARRFEATPAPDFVFERVSSTATVGAPPTRRPGFACGSDLAATRCVAADDFGFACASDLATTRRAAADAFRFVLRLAARCRMVLRPLAVAPNARTGVGAALDSESAALAISSIIGLPASNMLSRSNGPAEFTVSRKGFWAEMILTLVGW